MRSLLAAPLVFLRLIYQSTYLAIWQIWAKKTRSILTTTGIVIGVASVTAVIASLTGLKAKVLSDFSTFGAKSIYISHSRPETGPKRSIDWWALRFKSKEFDGLLEHCPSVEKFSRVAPQGQRYVVRYGEKSVEGVNITGVEPDWCQIENRPMLFGRPFSKLDEAEGRQVCIIDAVLRDKLGLDRDCAGQMVIMGGKSYLIIGVIDRRADFAVIGGGGGQENLEMYIPFKTVLKMMAEPFIYAMAASKLTELSDEAVAEIGFFLRHSRRLSPGEPDTFRVESLQGVLKQFNQVALAITLVASGVVGISLLVGGVGIMNIMLVSVSERTREIGLRKAVGARRSAILTQFLVEAVILSFLGGVIGLGVGKLLTIGICSLNKVLNMAQIPLWAVVLSFCFCGTVGIVFGMFPAIKAARLDPIEALRHE
ncbi:MAG: ABC transporter permease [Sedimentisphaerales bacterium]